MRVNGVAKAEITGGDTREFRVTALPEKLAAYRIKIGDIADAIQKSNLIASSGLVDNNYQIYLSLVSGLFTTTNDISSCVVAVRNGVPVRVSDLALVVPDVEDKYIRTTAHGKEAVLINIIKQPTGSTVQIGNDVITQLSTLKLPRGVRFENFYDQAGFIESSIRSTRDSIIIGIALAMVVLLIFLRSWRVTIVVALVVPATIATTFVCLNAVGKTINIMTLGGIAAAVGLIIDDSIVVIENIFAHFVKWKSNRVNGAWDFTGLAGSSLHELMPAIIGSTASTIVIHIPIAFLGGVTGAFFASLSVTMVFAMLISFLFSITLAPLLAALVLKEKDIVHEQLHEGHQSSLGVWYRGIFPKLLKYRAAFVPAALFVVYVTYYLYEHIGNDFMPDMDEGTFVLDYTSPPGTSLNETNRMLMNVENIIMAIPEVESYSRRTGTQLGFFLTEPNNGDYLVKLKNNRSRSIYDVIDEVRGKVNTAEPSLQIDFGQLMTDVIGDLTNNPSPIEIKLFGGDPKVLQNEANEVTSLIETVPGVVDAFNGIVISGPSLIIHVDPQKAAIAGLNAADITEELEAMMHGRADTQIQKGEKMIPVRVRYPNPYHFDMNAIEQLRLINSNGILVPLLSIATIERTAGQSEIDREGLRQFVAVTARISGRDLGRTIADIQQKFDKNLKLPQGMTLLYGGLYPDSARIVQRFIARCACRRYAGVHRVAVRIWGVRRSVFHSYHQRSLSYGSFRHALVDRSYIQYFKLCRDHYDYRHCGRECHLCAACRHIASKRRGCT